jgi:hypothetical protein
MTKPEAIDELCKLAKDNADRHRHDCRQYQIAGKPKLAEICMRVAIRLETAIRVIRES